MKGFSKSWKSFLLQESLNEYSIGGKIRLYHYSKTLGEDLVLDPEYFLSHRSSYSRKDHNTSDMPRVFFYTNLDHAEAAIKNGASLFTTFVSINDIYDLVGDPYGLKRKSAPYPDLEFPIPDYDRVLRSLAENPRKVKYGEPSKSLLEPGQGPYKGVFYTVGSMDVVTWFEPIKVEKFDPDNVEGPSQSGG